MSELKQKDVVYYARIIPTSSIYEVCELIIRTVKDTWFVGIDKRDKHAYLLNYSAFGKTVFEDRKVALKVVNEAEKKKTKVVSNESYYEEY